MDKVKNFKELNLTKENSVKLMHEAKDNGLTVAEYLEHIDPKVNYDSKDPLFSMSALERQYLNNSVALKSDPKAGIKPSYFLLDDPSQRFLFNEFVESELRQTIWDDAKYNINWLIAGTREINAEATKGLDLDMTALETDPYSNIGKLAKFPELTFTYSEHEAKLGKRGYALRWSYEFVRRVKADIIRILVNRIGLADAKSSFLWAVDGLYQGTSFVNASTYKASNEATIGAANPITYGAFLGFLNSFGDYTPTTIVGRFSAIQDVVTMSKPNISPAEAMKALQMANAESTPYVLNASNLNVSPELIVVPDSAMPADKLLGLDKRYALERIVELGSNINESTKFIENQSELMTKSINEGYSKIFTDATKGLTLGA